MDLASFSLADMGVKVMYSPRIEEVISEAMWRIMESSSDSKIMRVKNAGIIPLPVLGLPSARRRIGENAWSDRNAATRVDSGCDDSQAPVRISK